MQNVFKPRHNQKRKHKNRRFLILAGLTLIGLIALGGLRQEWVIAADTKVAATNRSYWRQASFPVENFQAYTSGFGYRPSPYGDSGWEFHSGLDIAAPDGSYIRNWWGGQVVEVSDDTACGTSIKIQSGEWKHIYCHMQGHVETTADGRYLIDRDGGLQIWEGQQVPTASRIGRVGMTGRTTGPHLHWGLKYDNQYIDPAMVLQAMYTNQSNLGSASKYSQQRD